MRPEDAMLLLLPLPLIGFVIREVRHVKWTLLESVLATVILGHVIVLPIVFAARTMDFNSNRADRYIAAGMLGLGLAAVMALTTVVTLRQLQAVNEQRTRVRVQYMLAGMLVIPSIALPPLTLLFWRTLNRLERRAQSREIANFSK